jgi:hypothetical protein
MNVGDPLFARRSFHTKDKQTCERALINKWYPVIAFKGTTSMIVRDEQNHRFFLLRGDRHCAHLEYGQQWEEIVATAEYCLRSLID